MGWTMRHDAVVGAFVATRWCVASERGVSHPGDLLAAPPGASCCGPVGTVAFRSIFRCVSCRTPRGCLVRLLFRTPRQKDPHFAVSGKFQIAATVVGRDQKMKGAAGSWLRSW